MNGEQDRNIIRTALYVSVQSSYNDKSSVVYIDGRRALAWQCYDSMSSQVWMFFQCCSERDRFRVVIMMTLIKTIPKFSMKLAVPISPGGRRGN